jgi:two-component sensor histidine kinase
MNLTVRLLLLAALAVLPALGIAAYNEHALRQSREAEVRAEVLRLTTQATSEMRQVIEGIQRVAVTLSQTSVVQEAVAGPAAAQACADFLVKIRREYPGDIEVGVAGLDGNVVCTSRGSTNAGRVRGSHPRRAVETGSFVVGGYGAGGAGERFLTFGYPIRNGEGRTVGSVLPGLGLEGLTQHMRQRFAGLDVTLAMADRDLTYLLRLPSDEVGLIGKPAPPESQRLAALANKGPFEVTGVDQVRRIAAIVPLTMSPDGSTKPDLLIAIGLSRDAAFAPIDAGTRRAVSLLVVSFALALVAAFIGGRYFVKAPVERLLTAAARWREGEYGKRVEIKGGEFGELGRALNLMAGEIERRELLRTTLINELNHRVKNTLTTVQSLAAQSLRGKESDQAQAAFMGRLFSLSKTHDVLTRENWGSADLQEVVDEVTRPYRQVDADRFEVRGSALRLQPSTALPLSMALHELCTNAVKYGALSNTCGSVEITWNAEFTSEERILHLRWQERGGPAVVEPSRKGFGTRLLEHGLARELNGRVEIRYETSGVVCDIEAPAPVVSEAPKAPRDVA